MWMTEIPPFVPFFIGAILAAVTRGNQQRLVMLSVPIIGGFLLLMNQSGVHWQLQFPEFQWIAYPTDSLSLLFGYLFHIVALISILFSLHIRDSIQHVSGLVYAGSALGLVFSVDFISVFIFWELMALSSVFLIWARRTPRAIQAGFRYLIFHVLSGVALLIGVLMHWHNTDSIALVQLELDGLSGWLIFLAIGIKCAFPLLHNWLTDAYPEATPTGTIFLSAFTTKVAVYMLAKCFPGTPLLIYIGAVMTCFPIFYAIIENDLRRVLAYSMINQIGFMVCGIGIGTALAINGAVAHAFTDVLFKGLLFMSMGAVLQVTGRIHASDLGGLYKTMPITTMCCIIGAASISAVPLFSGFVSKSMVMSAALEEGYDNIWLVLLFASAGVFHYTGIKIPFFAFFAQDAKIQAHDPPKNMILAMLLAAFLCVLIGLYPQLLYSHLPYATTYNPYTATHVIAQLQLLFFSALAFVWLKLSGLYPHEMHSVNLDSDWLYRRLFPDFIWRWVHFYHLIKIAVMRWVQKGIHGATKVFVYLVHIPGRYTQMSTGDTIFWVVAFLGGYLMLKNS